jgi:hypothetical protein
MKLVVTDACIFIDVIELQLTSEFFGLELEIHTTVDVINELFPQQQQLLRAYEYGGKLTIHVLTPADQEAISNENFPRALSPEDCSVIYIARKLNAVVLSSDKPVRRHAENLTIEYHGMFWIFDKLVEEKLLSGVIAISKLTKLMHSNIIYKSNLEMVHEVEKRIKSWAKL